jgi:hypothetical protein
MALPQLRHEGADFLERRPSPGLHLTALDVASRGAVSRDIQIAALVSAMNFAAARPFCGSPRFAMLDRVDAWPRDLRLSQAASRRLKGCRHRESQGPWISLAARYRKTRDFLFLPIMHRRPNPPPSQYPWGLTFFISSAEAVFATRRSAGAAP